MFIILREKAGAVFDDDLMAIYELAGFVESDTTDLVAIRKAFGDGLLIAEPITSDFDTMKSAIPGELDRAIDAWNAMTARINVHIDKVQNRARLVAPFRKWKKAIGRREYLLEQLIADVEAQPYIWPTIRFPWLFRIKDGDFNSDKVHARAFGKSGNGNGQITEKGFLALARTAAIWERDSGNLYVGGEGSHAAAFERAIGVSVTRFEELRKRFNGGSNA